jgi:hypothetical protein
MCLRRAIDGRAEGHTAMIKWRNAMRIAVALILSWRRQMREASPMRRKRSRSFLAAAIMPALIVDAMAAPRAVKPLVTVSDAADLVMA